MKVLNFGSLNIDLVYQVAAIVRPGETVSALSCQRYPGGKGLNQSIALARAGAKVFHAGIIGEDGLFLKELLEHENVDCSLMKISQDSSTGAAFIQVAQNGENAIVLSGGANQTVDRDYIADVLGHFAPGDILVIQNEISGIGEIISSAAQRGMKIFFNPAPMSKEIALMPLELVDTLILNDTEYETLSSMPGKIPENCNLLLTHGARGASYRAGKSHETIPVPAVPVENVIDTTAAGDTFIGFFITALLQGKKISGALHNASRAAALCVSRPGAAPSIPRASELPEEGK